MDEQIKPVAGCVIDKQRGLCDPFMATTVRDHTVWDEPYIAKLYSQQSIDALRAEVELARDGWHMANGTAELAMKHRDEAEAEADALRELCRDMLPVFEAARPLVLNLERLRDAAKQVAE